MTNLSIALVQSQIRKKQQTQFALSLVGVLAAWAFILLLTF